jgi:hypothetical protein
MKQGLLLVFLLATQLINSQSNGKNETKEINKNGYSIVFPATLRVDETTMNGSDFFLFTEKTSPEDSFVENINLVVQNLATLNIDLNRFVEITVSQINTRAKLIESQRGVSNGSEYHQLVYEGVFDGLTLKFLQYDFVKNDTAYILTYSAKKDEFDNYFVGMEKIMKSFTLR